MCDQSKPAAGCNAVTHALAPKTAPELLERALSALDKDLPYVVLRNYEGLPLNWGNDIDILMRPDDLRRAKDIILGILNRGAGDQTLLAMARWNFWSVRLACSDRTLQIDIYTGICKAWFTYAETEVILASSRRGSAPFAIPKKVHELLLIAAKELYAYGRIRSRYHARLAGHDVGESSAASTSLFGNYLTPGGCALIAGALDNPTVTGRPAINLRNLWRPRDIAVWAARRGNGWRQLPASKDLSS